MMLIPYNYTICEKLNNKWLLQSNIMETATGSKIFQSTSIDKYALFSILKRIINDKDGFLNILYVRNIMDHIMNERHFDAIGVMDSELPYLFNWILENGILKVKNGFCIEVQNNKYMIKGKYRAKEKVLLFSYIATTGKDIVKACKLIKRKKMNVKAILSFVDMLEGADELLKRKNYNFYTLFTIEELQTTIDKKIKEIKDQAEKEAIKKLNKKFSLRWKDLHLDENRYVIGLYLFGRGITKIPEEIKHLKHLKCLLLNNNKIPEISGLENLFQLRTLRLNKNKIRKIDNLDNLKELVVLNLSDNLISKITGLEKLTNLKVLKLSNECYNSTIDTLKQNIDLQDPESLILLKNFILKIEGLEQLKNLEQLELKSNTILKIEGLDQLKNLKNLDLIGNLIRKIEGLDNLKKLKFLSLGHNRIGKIEGLDNLGELQYLDLSFNYIFEKENLEHLHNLKECDLSYNYIDFDIWNYKKY